MNGKIYVPKKVSDSELKWIANEGGVRLTFFRDNDDENIALVDIKFNIKYSKNVVRALTGDIIGEVLLTWDRENENIFTASIKFRIDQFQDIVEHIYNEIENEKM